MTERTNEEWLADLQSEGERQAEALQDLQTRLQRGIFYYLSRERSDLTGLSTHELTQMAQDMAQDATLRVMENLTSFRGDSLFTTWATRVAVRVAISDLRRARYKDFSLDHITAEGDVLPPASTLVGGSRPLNPERAAEQTEILGKVQATLDDVLTERQQQALIAVAVRGVPLEIVAEQMQTNRNALYKLIHDARRKLRTHLEAQGLSLDYVLNLFQE
ncbi:MAG: sigma-70 family RNA polymerase sigma factor [Anaerolineae bacterium]|nr:sigma-70 family RNA polymerase sigma factor [Chloroflexota bacterium]MBN8637923.1 sigma-70 family RNA polymerase sigma factor [Anaerolineae bacterium]